MPSTSPLLMERQLSKAPLFVTVLLVLVRKLLALDQSPGSLSQGSASEKCNKIGNICCLKDNGKQTSRDGWMLGQAWSAGSLGNLFFLPERSCQELRQCLCHPKEGGAQSKKSGWEWRKNLQSGRSRYETLRRESSKQNLAKSPARPAARLVPASGRLCPPVLLLRQRIFHSCQTNSTSIFFQAVAVLKWCSLLSLSAQQNKLKPICSCLEPGCHRLTFAVQFLFLSRRESSLEGKNCSLNSSVNKLTSLLCLLPFPF